MDISKLPFSAHKVAGDTVYLSGIVGLRDGKLVEGGLAAELRQAIENMTSVLTSMGLKLNNVVDVTVFLTDMNDYAPMNEVYGKAFGEIKPTRTCVAVASLPLRARVELKAVASR